MISLAMKSKAFYIFFGKVTFKVLQGSIFHSCIQGNIPSVGGLFIYSFTIVVDVSYFPSPLETLQQGNRLRCC